MNVKLNAFRPTMVKCKKTWVYTYPGYGFTFGNSGMDLIEN